MPASRARTRKRPGQGHKPQAPKGRRRDPRSRRYTDGASGWAALGNADPTRKYVLVSQRDKDQGPDYYGYLGYIVEVWREDGPVFKRGHTGKMGEEMTMRGHLLMSIKKTSDDPDELTAEAIEDYGPDGETGQARADEIEDMIIQRAGGEDLLRGLVGQRYARTQNLTRENEYES